YGVQQGMKEGLEQGMKEGLEIGMQKGMQKGMEQGMQKGMEQGIEEGRAAMSIEIAKKLKALNYSSAEISKATGLPVHQIENL
ncbi:MAG: Yae1 family protein, partial [Prevotella sp.]